MFSAVGSVSGRTLGWFRLRNPPRRAFQIPGDRLVVGAGLGERLAGEPQPGFEGRPAVQSELGEELVVLIGGGEHRDVVVILGGAANQRGAADVDVLDGLFKAGVRSRDRRLERIQVHDHQVDRLHAGGGEGVDVFGQVAAQPGCRRESEGAAS